MAADVHKLQDSLEWTTMDKFKTSSSIETILLQ